ncbi:hypothetical protein RDABS01_007391 [Bienertia sinuspersici]
MRGSESLPRERNSSQSSLAMAVWIKQIELVNAMVGKINCRCSDLLRYISIVKEEGLQISQPALDGYKSEVHHQITACGRREGVHRRIYKNGECEDDSKCPSCTGWIKFMAPVFSRPALRCVWYMIQITLGLHTFSSYNWIS